MYYWVPRLAALATISAYRGRVDSVLPAPGGKNKRGRGTYTGKERGLQCNERCVIGILYNRDTHSSIALYIRACATGLQTLSCTRSSSYRPNNTAVVLKQGARSNVASCERTLWMIFAVLLCTVHTIERHGASARKRKRQINSKFNSLYSRVRFGVYCVDWGCLMIWWCYFFLRRGLLVLVSWASLCNYCLCNPISAQPRVELHTVYFWISGG